MKKVLSAMLVLTMLGMVACSSNTTTTTTTQITTQAAATNSDYSGNQTQITLSNSGIEVEGEGATVQDNKVTITEGGTYTVTGTLTNGNLVADAAGEDVNIILKDASITNSSGPAVLIEDAQNALITIEGDNTLQDGGAAEEDGALYGKVSYTIDGAGNLTVDGAVEEGIASEMHLTIEGGNITINAKDDGINANNDGISEITINGGSLYIVAGGDGIDSNGSLTINGGTVVTQGALTGGDEGMDADGTIAINGGTVLSTGAQMSSISGSQTTISYSANNQIAAGSTISIRLNGEEIFTTKLGSAAQVILYSDANIQENTDYELYVDGSMMGTMNSSNNAANSQGPGGVGRQ